MLDLFFLGVDGLSANILLDGIEKGWYPNFGKLIPEAAYGTCLTEEMPTDAGRGDWGIFTGPSWANIYTGCRVHTHGITDILGQPKKGSRTFKNLSVRCIWDWLNDAGYCAGVFNMPMTWPARVINGFMFSGFPAADLSTTGLKRQVAVPLWACTLLHQATKDNFTSWDAALEEYYAVEHLNLEYYQHLAHQVDVLFAAHVVLDRVGHEVQTWFHGGPIIEPSLFYDSNILLAYRWFDQFLGQILKAVPSRYLAIVSDHGWSRPGEIPCHTRDGVFILRGPNVLPQKIELYNYDVAPTILERMGIPIRCDGASVLYKHNMEDQAVIERRLRDLGYTL